MCRKNGPYAGSTVRTISAATLSLTGGLVGVLLGFVAATSVSQLLRWSTNISVGAVALSFGIAALVGILFGWYPAREAARLLPIESVRYE